MSKISKMMKTLLAKIKDTYRKKEFILRTINTHQLHQIYFSFQIKATNYQRSP